jgi:hypothetical protein
VVWSAVAGVGHDEFERVGAVAEQHRSVRAPGVLDDVGQRLLQDPECREVDALGERARVALDGEVHPQAGRARALEQSVEVGQPGLGRALGRLVLAGAQQLERAVHLGHRLPAEVGDPRRGLGDALVGHGRAQRLRLDDDQAHVVRDDVVELLGDPHPLLRDRPLGEQLALAVQPLGALAQHVEALAPAAHEQPDAGADGARERDRDQVVVGELAPARAHVDQPGDGRRGRGGDRRLPRALRADRVQRHHDREHVLPVHRRYDGDAERDRQHRERPAPPHEQRQRRGKPEQHSGHDAVLLQSARQGGSDHGYADRHRQRHVDHPRRRLAQPRAKGRGHALSVSPAPTCVD